MKTITNLNELTSLIISTGTLSSLTSSLLSCDAAILVGIERGGAVDVEVVVEDTAPPKTPLKYLRIIKQ